MRSRRHRGMLDRPPRLATGGCEERPSGLASAHDMFLPRFGLVMAPQILMEDDFRQGLDLTSRWAITRFPPRFSADDGIVSASDRGLYVKAAGTDSQTGEPAFPGFATRAEDLVKGRIRTPPRSSHPLPGFAARSRDELPNTIQA